MMKEDNQHRCDSIFNPTESQRYRCMLPEGHEEAHIWFITWHPEEESDQMQ
ncbi:MAG: hypothetical protein OEY10_08510 [Nitrosopumilus sp.]|nr:hypothetical protein [Nitrosopumilus sp.]